MSVATTALPATLTLAEARDVLERLRGQESVLLDASGLQRFDSAALAVLLALKREAQARGAAAWAIHNPPPKLRQLAKMYGVDEVLGLEAGAGPKLG
jgi:phospholipid transport system transporter-binding protein